MKALKNCPFCGTKFDFNDYYDKTFCSSCSFHQYFENENIVSVIFLYDEYFVQICLLDKGCSIYFSISSSSTIVAEETIKNWQPDFSNIQQLKNKLENILLLS